ncbi:MAG: response regulator [Cyanobacteriota bacterium]|nr:response regulator [Cyanobacteriota bacterium]
MQGNLSEIDIRSILQLVELGQRTGELFVEAYHETSSTTSGLYGIPYRNRDLNLSQDSWFVFFANGQIVYAAHSRDSTVSRLGDYLRRYGLDAVLDNFNISALSATNAPEYGYLWRLLENHQITPEQGRSIIRSMVRETLFDLLSLHQGAFAFDMGPALAPQLMTLNIGSLVREIIKQVPEWKQLHPLIQSPGQCPIVSDPESLRSTLPPKTFETLIRWADGKTSIRQLSRYLNRDIIQVAKAIYPYIQEGLVQLSPPLVRDRPKLTTADAGLRPAAASTPRVVCIDDDLVVRKTVEKILKPPGYEITTISSSLKALSLVFGLKPDLILCDIAMPEPDGYEICAMLRRSTAFRQKPIVMLTGKDGFIDRVKARMVGATDYLTKPFGDRELLTIVEKYVGSVSSELSPQERGLADALREVLGED